MSSTLATTDVYRVRVPSGEYILVGLADPPDTAWAARVGGALAPRRVVFSWPAAGAMSLRCVQHARDVPVTPQDTEAVQLFTAGATISVERVDGVLTPEALQASLDRENRDTLTMLVNSVLAPTGIIPFVGAGMSVPYGVPMWGDFLNLAAVSEEEKRADVARLVTEGSFEQAAKLLDSGLSRDQFQKLIAERLDVTVDDARLRRGPLALLPRLTSGPVITTNFDRVIEAFYAEAHRAFEDDLWIPGREPRRILDAIQQNRHALIKLHGDVRLPETRTFTSVEYEESYGNVRTGKRGALMDLGNVVYTNRPLLFLGCSLENDRTLQVLEKVTAQNPYLRHFAILSANELISAMDARRAALARCCITPLWFSPDRFDQIETLLARLLERSSVEPVAPDPSWEPCPAAAPFLPPRRVTEGIHPGGGLSAEITGEHLTDVSRSIADGQLIFFLGSALSRTSFIGNPFYQALAEKLHLPTSDRNRADVAEQAEDLHGRPLLSRAIEEMISTCPTQPGFVHRLIASLARRPTVDGVQQPLLVFTTNYDDVLENTLAAAAVPYHFFLYQAGGPYDGCFVHRAPDGIVRAIRNPNGVYVLTAAPLILVKMNGGLDPARELHPYFVVTSRDFVVLAARIPAILPAVIREHMREKSMLFIGHGMAEPDVREFARYAKKERGARKSWAIQWPEKRDEAYWRASRGVEILKSDRDIYVLSLSRSLESRFGIKT